jgi:hypothetical protein
LVCAVGRRSPFDELTSISTKQRSRSSRHSKGCVAMLTLRPDAGKAA